MIEQLRSEDAARGSWVFRHRKALAALSDSDLKDAIAKLNDGKRPVGNPSRATLETAYKELQAA